MPAHPSAPARAGIILWVRLTRDKFWTLFWKVLAPLFGISDEGFVQYLKKSPLGLFMERQSTCFDCKNMQTVQYILRKSKVSSPWRTSSEMCSKVDYFGF